MSMVFQTTMAAAINAIAIQQIKIQTQLIR